MQKGDIRIDDPSGMLLVSGHSFVAVTEADSVAERGISCHLVGETAVVICRFRDEYFALENKCSHALSTFDEGRLRGYRLHCPLHGASFDVRDGSAQSLPAKMPIRTFPLRIVDGIIEVDVGE